MLGRSHWPAGLQPLACWDCGLESLQGHGCLSLALIVCFPVGVSATGRFVVQRKSTELVGVYV